MKKPAMNVVVAVNNNFLDIPLNNFTAREIDYLHTILAKVKGKFSKSVEITFYEIKKLCNMPKISNTRLINELIQMNSKILTLNLVLETKEKVTQVPLFIKFEIDKQRNAVIVKMSKEFCYMVNELWNNFTKFEVVELTALKSKYSKLIFRQLMRYKNGGYNTDYAFWAVPINEFRRIVCVPDKYQMKDINKRIIEPACKEIGEILADFSYREVKNGRNVETLVFEFAKLPKPNNAGDDSFYYPF